MLIWAAVVLRVEKGAEASMEYGAGFWGLAEEGYPTYGQLLAGYFSASERAAPPWAVYPAKMPTGTQARALMALLPAWGEMTRAQRDEIRSRAAVLYPSEGAAGEAAPVGVAFAEGPASVAGSAPSAEASAVVGRVVRGDAASHDVREADEASAESIPDEAPTSRS